MIVDAFLTVVLNFCTWFVGLLPDFPVPGFLTGGATTLQSLLAQVGALGAWLPLNVLGTCISSIAGAWAIAGVIRLFRIVLSLFTAGGGAAG